MNRLSAYLASAKLAKLHIAQAEECWAQDKDSKAIKNICAAMRELITANNNLASIAFGKKPKAARRRKTQSQKAHEAALDIVAGAMDHDTGGGTL